MPVARALDQPVENSGHANIRSSLDANRNSVAARRINLGVGPVQFLTFASLAALLAIPAGPLIPQLADHPGISIVTVNMAKETSPDRVLREWRGTAPLRNADVFLLQEVKEEAGKSCIAERLVSALGFQVAYSPEAPGVTDRGLAILSRFPLREIQIRRLRSFDLHFHTRARFALSATAITPWGPVGLSDVHLDTRLNAAERLAQLEPVLGAGAIHGRQVVAGDFNSNPFYWIDRVIPVPQFRSQALAVDEFMKRRGFRTAVPESATTFDHLGMHLDWIWTAGSLRPAASRVVPLDFSDHHAVWARVELWTGAELQAPHTPEASIMYLPSFSGMRCSSKYRAV